jgi:hypothetical protein
LGQFGAYGATSAETSTAAAAKSTYAWAIHCRGPAQYQVRIRRKHWPRLNRTFGRLADAEAAVRSVEDPMQLVGKSATEKKLARYKQAQVVTLSDFLRKRLKTVEAQDPKSADAYRLRALLECFLADLPIADLQPAHFEAHIESRGDDDVSGAAIRRELHMLSRVVSEAMRSYPGVRRAPDWRFRSVRTSGSFWNATERISACPAPMS